MTTWRKTTTPLPTGWYWWRMNATDTEPEMYYSNGVSNVRLSQCGLDYYADEDVDWSCEWWGPIEPPVDLQTK